MRERLNIYDCLKCNLPTVTVDVDEGVTPFMLDCRSLAGCDGMAQSRFYQVPPELTVADAMWEWFRPTAEETAQMSEPMQEHVRLGGLEIRRRGPGRE